LRVVPRELATARLLLRAFAPADEATLLAQWNDAEVARYLFDGEAVSVEMVRRQIEASETGRAEGLPGLFTLALREAPGESIGFAGLRRFGERRLEVLYALLPRYWGRGLATEAARAVLELGFAAGEPEIWAGADPPNAASFRVMERLGMTFVEELTLGGRPARYYRISRPELNPSSSRNG
jgi:[ribosomal protein S5]-alanine N-acetyltransferase